MEKLADTLGTYYNFLSKTLLHLGFVPTSGIWSNIKLQIYKYIGVSSLETSCVLEAIFT